MQQSCLCSSRGLEMQGLAKDDGSGLGPEGVTQPPGSHPVRTPSRMVLHSSEYEGNGPRTMNAGCRSLVGWKTRQNETGDFSAGL